MTKLRYTMFVVTIFLVLALSAMSAVPALADDTTPPPTDTPTLETPPTEEVTEEAAPVVDEAPPTEVPVVEETLPEETAPVEETVAELLTQIPEGTELVVVNEAGETVPLVTQEAADAIAVADPIWCPAGVAPKPGIGGCTATYTTLENLITAYTSNAIADPAANGTIWITGYAAGGNLVDGSTAPIIIDGSNLSLGSWKNFSLTINGGWVGGVTGSTVLNPNDQSQFDQPINILNWNNAITINNILIANSTTLNALDVGTSGNITLNNVDVTDNTGTNGATLDNTAGIGNVVINDSTFNGNDGSGLTVLTDGTITAKNLSANNNVEDGAYFDNRTAATPKAVTLTGSNNFKFNGLGGLTVYSKGAITLSNVTAMNNTGGSGAYLDNCLGFDVDFFCLNSAASAVTLKGVNNFNNNGWDGLRVWSPGVITANSITANDNGTDTNREAASVSNEYDSAQEYDGYGKGAFLNNWGAWSLKAITLTGTNTFNGNASNGLLISNYGALKVNNLTASSNGCDILFDTDLSFCAGAYLEAFGITQTGYGIFSGNDTDGLFANSFDTLITLNNLYAELNGEDGVFVDTYGSKPANVSILGTNVFNENSFDGLVIYTNGVVTLNNLTANNNGFDGVYVDNTNAATPKAVSILGTNVFNGNGGNGLTVYSYGAIVTNNLTAESNTSGVDLDNCLDGLIVQDGACDGYSAQPITMNGLNNISNNVNSGLFVTSQGVIKVNNLSATFNGGLGASLDNQWSDAVGAVTLTGYANVSNNISGSGLEVYSTGAITLANLTANGNGQAGVVIVNNFNPLKPANVTISGINQFNFNGFNGLGIYSYGVILLNNLTANFNGNPGFGYGVDVDNAGGVKSMAVTLNGINTFNGNFSGGLSILSKGAIVVNKVMANDNNIDVGSIGVDLYNQFDLFTAPITILGYGIFNNNSGDGLQAFSNGTITTNNLTANTNDGKGADINNHYNALAASAVNVVMNGVNTFNDNISDGLSVFSDGMITLNNITANGNDGYGAYLDNNEGNLLKNITLNGNNTFVGNFFDGLYFDSSGSVTMMRVTADSNAATLNPFTSSGINGTAVGNITLTCASLNFNEGAGYNFTVGLGKIITLKGVFSYGNLLVNVANVTPIVTRTCTLP